MTIYTDAVIPDPGTLFIDGEDRLSQMITPRQYQVVGTRNVLCYIPESVEFSIKRMATEEDIKSNQQEKENMNDFYVQLPVGHDTTIGLTLLEKMYIEYVHKLSRFNQSKTAKALGISRGSLRMKLEQYFPGQYIGSR